MMGINVENFPTSQEMQRRTEEMQRRTEEINTVIAKIKLNRLLNKMKVSKNYFIVVHKKDFPATYQEFLEKLEYKITIEKTEFDVFYKISWEK